MKKIAIFLILILSMNSSRVYAENASKLLAIYGYEKAISQDKEHQKLLNIEEAYNSVDKQLKSEEIMEEAINLYNLNHQEALKTYDMQIDLLEKELTLLREKIYSHRQDSVAYLLELDSTYLRTATTLEGLVEERTIIEQQPDNLYTDTESTREMRKKYEKLEKQLAYQEKKLEKATSYPELGNIKNLAYPLSESSYVTSGFGQRTDPFNPEETQFHNGLDLSVDMNTDVKALFHGTVETVSESDTIGYYIIVNHGKSIKTLYGHLDYYSVEEGQEVKQGDIIASSGNSGTRTTGPHLHLGLYINGVAVDPSKVFQ